MATLLDNMLSDLGAYVGKQGKSGAENNRLIIQDDKKYWDVFASESPEKAEMVNNIRKFPFIVSGGQVMYQIPMTYDDIGAEQGWRSMNHALQDYNYIDFK
jgi:hypothetical protein